MITYTVYSDIGNRDKNEDSVGNFHTAQRDIFALADGLGGHGQGEIASATAVETAGILMESEGDNRSNLLSDIFEEAQKKVMNIQGGMFANGMKTTLVVLDICRDQIRWAHIGDSRLYYFQNNNLIKRTLDHSVPQMLVLAHKLKEKKIRGHEDRNKLLRVIGSPWDTNKYDCSEAISKNGFQAFLLCSDGFWELIDEKNMTKTLKKASSVDEWMKAMVDIVKKNGINSNMDNNSAIAVWIK